MSLRKMYMALAAKGGLVPFVSDIEIIFSVSSGVCNAGIIFNDVAQGVGSVTSLVKRHSTTYLLMGDDDAVAPVDHTGEWTGDSVTAADWEVACISEDAGTWDFSHAAVGVYTSFATADMQWRENRTGGKGYTPGTNTVTATFRIREVATPSNFVDFEVIATAIQT